jgi:four helix bundle protein
MEHLIQKFRFRKFPVYKDARDFSRSIKTLVREKFPKYELFSLTNQLSRAADSIVLNIAEGCDRGSDKDFTHFLNISHTSLNEVVACIDDLINKAAALANQLTAFRSNILKNPKK